jgi:hypothetical protein
MPEAHRQLELHQTAIVRPLLVNQAVSTPE